ncbi:hypothetical protein PMAYCL1PPCAC_19807, partial [Pristionchus mayeri]
QMSEDNPSQANATFSLQFRLNEQFLSFRSQATSVAAAPNAMSEENPQKATATPSLLSRHLSLLKTPLFRSEATTAVAAPNADCPYRPSVALGKAA